MNDKFIELAKRAVACRNWKWMSGMKAIHESGWGEPASQRVPCTIPNGGYPNSLPDPTDSATIGCLLDLVRKAWHTAPANVNCHVSYSPEKGHYRYWTCSYCTGEKWEQTQGETEAEALILALEASNA